MPFYTDLIVANPSGWHTFDAKVLDLLPGNPQTVDKGQTPDGVIVEIVNPADQSVILDDILVHRNGRAGAKDLTQDTLVLRIQQLAALSTAYQAIFFNHERVHGKFFRKDEP